MLTLYYKPTCPYSQRVLAAADEMGVQFNLKNIAGDDALSGELIERGGKRQVPYLVDEARKTQLYESEDIVHYLEKHYNTTGSPHSVSRVRVHRGDSTCDVCE